jgi:hypothetical protein
MEWRKIFWELKNGEILVSTNLWITIMKNVKNDKRQNYDLQLSAISILLVVS